MIPNRLRTSFIAPAFLLTMLACAIPGLTFSQSDPLLDENAMNTASPKHSPHPLHKRPPPFLRSCPPHPPCQHQPQRPPPKSLRRGIRSFHKPMAQHYTLITKPDSS